MAFAAIMRYATMTGSELQDETTFREIYPNGVQIQLYGGNTQHMYSKCYRW